jgi:uncharacterized protein YjbJ (UPF0337 family)
MGELIDKAKGKVKESVGRNTGDKSLENEGKMDTLKGNVKGAIDTAKQRVKDAVNDGKRERDANTNVPR